MTHTASLSSPQPAFQPAAQIMRVNLESDTQAYIRKLAAEQRTTPHAVVARIFGRRDFASPVVQNGVSMEFVFEGDALRDWEAVYGTRRSPNEVLRELFQVPVPQDGQKAFAFG